jgi:hypothetical protein
MKLRILASCIATALLAACSGAGNSGPVGLSPSTPQQTVQVHLVVTAPTTTSATARKPLHVSTATTAGFYSIDGTAPVALICEAPPTCTAAVNVIASAGGVNHTFAAQLTDGTNVLSEGTTGTVSVTTSTTTESIPTNGVAAKYTLGSLTVSGSGGTIPIASITDAAGVPITTETAYDNGSLTIQSSNTGLATVSGSPAILSTPGGSGSSITIACVSSGTFTVNVLAGSRGTLYATLFEGAGTYPASSSALALGSGSASFACQGATLQPG